LRLSSDFAIDTDAYKREGLRISILAMSGHGKSNAAADLVEDVLDDHAQVIIIEPIPEWHTLKARYNNVVVIGGPYQDLPLEPAFAHEYVQAALEKGISLVVNVSDIEDDADQIKFVSSFLWNLYRLEQKYRRVLFLVLEEADIWAPQMWDQVSKQSLSRVSLIAKHGRKIGIFPILISQRPADLHKSPLSQCNVNLFGKFTSPADLDSKTGVMFVAKKLHLPIQEEQIMSLETGSFLVSDKTGVHSVAVRKRLCPHGADTPLIEAKPFSADLSNALGGLLEEIQKAVEARKAEDSAVKRLEKENEALRRNNKELEAKANIKISVKEMMEGNGVVHNDVHDHVQHDITKVKEENLAFLQQLGQDKGIIEDLTVARDEALKKLRGFEKLREALTEILPTTIRTVVPAAEKGAVAGLQKVITIADVPEVQKALGPYPDDTVKGKILALAKKGKLEKWCQLGEIVKAIEEERWNASPQEANNALNDLVKEDLIAKKHTDRNYYCLAQGVRFKEGS
jgi:hypothetical protein